AVFQKGNTAQIKNEILDTLDLNVLLPKLSLPGISDVATIQHTTLTIKGINNNGTRSIDTLVGGELDVPIKSNKVVLDYRALIHKQQGQADTLALSATQRKGDVVTLDLVETFKISDLDLEVTKQNGKYKAQLLGSSTFRNKPVKIGYRNSPNPNLYVATSNLTLKDLIGSSIGVPEIDNIAFSGVGVTSDYLSMGVEVQGQEFYGLLAKPSGQAKPFFILRGAKPNFSITTLIPGADKTPLKDTDFEQAVLFYNPTNKSGLLNTFPEVIRPYFHGNVAVKPGLNIYGTLAVHPSGEMASLLKMAGITDVKLPLNGAFSPKIFSKNMAAVKNDILDNLDINVPLPKINVADISKFANIQNTALIIKGQNESGIRSLDFGIGGELDIPIKSNKVVMDYKAVIHKQQGQPNTL
ncbi:hypothetical protein WH96_20810, partial [Kiloniella spongiae]